MPCSQEVGNQDSESQSSQTQDSESQSSENQDSGNQDSGEQELNYTVTFKDGNKEETITVKEGEKVTIPAWTKEGYTLGWDADLTDVAITENKTVNAVWAVNTYSAKIVRADGTEETVEFTIENRTNKLATIALTESNAQYSYAWSANLPTELALNNDQVFTETRTVNQYTITFNRQISSGSALAESASYTSRRRR